MGTIIMNDGLIGALWHRGWGRVNVRVDRCGQCGEAIAGWHWLSPARAHYHDQCAIGLEAVKSIAADMAAAQARRANEN